MKATLVEIFSIDPSLLKIKFIFFVFFAAAGSLFPFLFVYFQDQLKFTKPEIGILSGLQTTSRFFSSIFWGVISDKFEIHKKIFLINLVFYTALKFMMGFFSQFWVMALLLLTSEFTGAALTPLFTAATMDLLGDERKLLYPKQRLWGSVGYGAVSAIMGGIASAVKHDYKIFFYSWLGFNIFTFGISLSLNYPSPEQKEPFWKYLKTLCNPPVFILLFFICWCGFASGVLGTFLGIYLTDLEPRKDINLIIGMGVLCSAISELVIFFTADLLIMRIGERNVLYLTSAAYCIRFLWYSFLQNPWVVLPAELLHGITLGAFWSAVIIYSRSLVPETLSGTMQGLLFAMFSGVGEGLGGFVGGVLYKYFSGQGMWRIMSAYSVLGGVVYFVMNYLCDNCYVKKIEKEKVDSGIIEDDEEIEVKPLMNDKQ